MSRLNSLAINGRFLTQSSTGVQRYAVNVTRSIGQAIVSETPTVTLLSPKSAKDPEILGIRFNGIGSLSGQAWEQFSLPRAWQGQLLNLCNTGPVAKNNQVICMHDANVFIAPESYGAAFRLYYKALQPLLVRGGVKVTTVSNFSAKQIAKYLGLKSSNITVLPNGHEHVHGWNSSLAVKAPALIGGKNGRAINPFVMALGSRARHKNLSMLFGLANELEARNIDLVVAGGQSDIFAKSELMLKKNIKHLGVVTDHDLAYLMEHALCLAFPSFTEGFGLPALEAMAVGCPVISTDRASLPEICGNAALFASPDQPRQWIENIERLSKSADLRESLIGNGRDQVKRFSWADTANGYLDLYASL